MKDWYLWTLIPALMLFTLTFFLAFDNYTTNEWMIGNGIVSLGICFIYIGEGVYNKFKKRTWSEN